MQAHKAVQEPWCVRRQSQTCREQVMGKDGCLVNRFGTEDPQGRGTEDLQRWLDVRFSHLSKKRLLLFSDDRREFSVFAETSRWLISSK